MGDARSYPGYCAGGAEEPMDIRNLCAHLGTTTHATTKKINANLEPTKITLDTNDSIIFYICLTYSQTVGWTVGRARSDGQPDR